MDPFDIWYTKPRRPTFVERVMLRVMGLEKHMVALEKRVASLEKASVPLSLYRVEAPTIFGAER